MSSQADAWNQEYDSPQFLSLDTQPQQDVVRFVRWLKKEGKELLGRDILAEAPFVLDLGCGTGRNLQFLATEYGAHGVGYDIASSAVTRARQLALTAKIEGVNYSVHSIADPYDIPDQSVDIALDITASNSLYEGERIMYLDQLARVLKRDGVLCVRSLCRDGDRNAQNLQKQFPGPEHDTYILPDVGIMERMFTEKDFRVTYGQLFDILEIKKQTGYQRWGSQWFKRRYIVAYMKLR